MPPTPGRTVFHDGELAVQRRAGVERIAARIGLNISPSMPDEYGSFLSRQPFVVVAGQDAEGRVWSSLIVGGVGFARVLDDRRLLLEAELAPGDPLEHAFEPPGSPIGLLAIEFHQRARIRLNGTAQRTGNGIVVAVAEAYGNCHKYIQRRVPVARLAPAADSRPRQGTALDERQARLIRGADTFFIASAHPQRGADASHRGGRPGFVHVGGDGSAVRFPDYSGNRMFQTLGNLTVDPRAGLLFLNWDSGTTVQLTGRAEVVWADGGDLAALPGAERAVDVSIDAVLERERAMPARWNLIEASRLNP